MNFARIIPFATFLFVRYLHKRSFRPIRELGRFLLAVVEGLLVMDRDYHKSRKLGMKLIVKMNFI